MIMGKSDATNESQNVASESLCPAKLWPTDIPWMNRSLWNMKSQMRFIYMFIISLNPMVYCCRMLNIHSLFFLYWLFLLLSYLRGAGISYLLSDGVRLMCTVDIFSLLANSVASLFVVVVSDLCGCKAFGIWMLLLLLRCYFRFIPIGS